MHDFILVKLKPQFILHDAPDWLTRDRCFRAYEVTDDRRKDPPDVWVENPENSQERIRLSMSAFHRVESEECQDIADLAE